MSKQYELLWYAANDLLTCMEEDLQREGEIDPNHEFQMRMSNLRSVLQGEDPAICSKCYHGLKEEVCDLINHFGEKE